MADNNTTYLAKLWLRALPAIIVGVIAIVAVLYGVASGTAPWPVIIPLALVALMIPIVVKNVNSDVARLIRKPNPSELVKYYQVKMGSAGMQDADAMIAYSAGLVYAYYGDFAHAREQLRAVEWQRRAPMIQAMGVALEGVLEYLETGNYFRGSGLMRRARLLVDDIPTTAPGAKQAQHAYDLLVCIGEVLTGRARLEHMTELVAAIPKMQLLMKPLVAWSLAVAYARMGDMRQAEQMLTLVKSIVPYCKAVTSLPVVSVS